MPKITIADVGHGADGEYTLDLNRPFTGREAHIIKQISGVRLNELGEAMEAGDYDFLIALAHIAAKRSGRDVSVDALLDAQLGAISFEPTAEEAEESGEDESLPPVSAPSGRSETPTELASSGPVLRTVSDSPETTPLPSGVLALATGSASGQATSGN